MKILGIVLCGCVLQVQMFAAAASGFAVPGVVRPVPRGLEGLLNVVNQCDSVAFKNILKNPREFLGLGDSQKSSLMEAIAGQQLAIKQIRKEILDVWAAEGRFVSAEEGFSLDISALIDELALLVTICQWERFATRLADARAAGLNYSLFAYVGMLFEEREAGIAQIDTHLKQVCARPEAPESGLDNERGGGGGCGGGGGGYGYDDAAAAGGASLSRVTRAELDTETLAQCQWELFECIQNSNKDDTTAVGAVNAFIGNHRRLYPYLNQILTEPLPEVTNYRGSLMEYVRYAYPEFKELARKLATVSRFVFPRNRRLTDLLVGGK